ncbi:MAG: hypothetical protein QM572_02510 [Nocardioides sp.]|uniref:DUF7064 domain-containing protein n=1 Tax=Nocardioides sp. TaxID=35761 RepID=UPI0039E5D496
MRLLTSSEDELVTGLPAGAGPDFFDRFYFNLHPASAPTPLIMVGAGVYPGRGLTDGYVIVVREKLQSNLRFSTTAPGPVTGVGPLAWSTAEPLSTWSLRLGANPLGVELDVTWTARTSPWRTEDIVVDNGRGGRSDFSHFFQSGSYSGRIVVDGTEVDASTWLGQRDRSRGVRVVAGGQGLHLWVQAQFADRSVAFIMDEDRAYQRRLLDGAVLWTDGSADPITDVRHTLSFDDGLDLTSGELAIRTASGDAFTLHVDGSAGGGFLSGGGYGGWHGQHHGTNALEHDDFPLDGTVTPRNLDMPLTDRPAAFRIGDEAGTGVFEFAVTRSPSYRYRASA